jgi:hypothetical protein
VVDAFRWLGTGRRLVEIGNWNKCDVNVHVLCRLVAA